MRHPLEPPDGPFTADPYERSGKAVRLTVEDLLETEGGLKLLAMVMGIKNAVAIVVGDTPADLRLENGTLHALCWEGGNNCTAYVRLPDGTIEHLSFASVYVDFRFVSATSIFASRCDAVA